MTRPAPRALPSQRPGEPPHDPEPRRKRLVGQFGRSDRDQARQLNMPFEP